MGLVDEFGHVVDRAPRVRVLEERPAEVTVCEVHVVTTRHHHLDTKSTDQRKETNNAIMDMVNENSLGLNCKQFSVEIQDFEGNNLIT